MAAGPEPELGPFASSSIAEHLARGCAALILLVLAGRFASTAWLAFACGAGALVAMRGCPLCWTMGLFVTVRARLLRSRPPARESAPRS